MLDCGTCSAVAITGRSKDWCSVNKARLTFKKTVVERVMGGAASEANTPALVGLAWYCAHLVSSGIEATDLQ
jgi:hypothetical protein